VCACARVCNDEHVKKLALYWQMLVYNNVVYVHHSALCINKYNNIYEALYSLYMFLNMFLVFDIKYHCIHYQVRHGRVGLKVGYELSLFSLWVRYLSGTHTFYMDIFTS
jgi:hypothetical protein